MKKIISGALIACILLSFALIFVGCGLPEGGTTETEMTFTLEVVHLDGTQKSFEVKTYQTILADALTEKGYISGHDSQYGLTVETVDGETLDWETSGAYWTVYVNGEYAMVGVSSIYVEDGATYSFKAEKM